MPTNRLNPHRRILLGASSLALLAPSWARAQAPTAQAVTFIQQAGQDLARLVGGARSVEEKRRKLQPFIDRVVDVDAVARFCLGRYWAKATPAQRTEYVRLFHSVLLTNVVSRMGDYQHTEVHVIVGQPDAREDGVHVPTVVERTNNPPARVVWLVRPDQGDPRIVDVIAEGTSLRLTVRSDYNAFLSQHGNDIDALIAALRRQEAQNAG